MTLEKEQMIRQQIRTAHVDNPHVLEVLHALPRDAFVPESYRHLAYADLQTPIGHDQVMFSPREEAITLQALHLKPHETVLEIGTGSGYFTALMAKMCKQVTTIDIFEDFSDKAREKLSALGIDNVIVEKGDASSGWKKDHEYDVIVVTASLKKLPEQFKNNLSRHGRLFVILGEAPLMQAMVVQRLASDVWQQKDLFETMVPRMILTGPLRTFEF